MEAASSLVLASQRIGIVLSQWPPGHVDPRIPTVSFTTNPVAIARLIRRCTADCELSQ